jgi:hypothetical protein
VGDRIAARAFPDGFRDGILDVRVVNSSWRHELSFLQVQIVAKANEICGDPPLVRGLNLHLGSRRMPLSDQQDVVAALARRRPVRTAPRPRPRPSAEDLARIDAETEQIADSELRTALRSLRRKLGL